jgi:hypothetical protein
MDMDPAVLSTGMRRYPRYDSKGMERGEHNI